MAGMRYQPQGRLRINWRNPLTRGLVFCAPGVGGVYDDIAGGKKATVTGVTRQSNKDGQFGYFNGAAWIDYPAFGPELPASGQITVAFIDQAISPSGNGTTLDIMPYGGNAELLVYQGASPYGFVVGPRGPSGSNIPAFQAMTGSPVNGALRRIVVRSTGNLTTLPTPPANWTLFVGQNKYTTGATEPISAGAASMNRWGAVTGGTECWDGIIGQKCIWNRALTDAEVLSYQANPWQIFEAPEEDDELFTAAAPGSYTLTAEPGSFGLSGSAATLRVSRKLAGGNGSFSLTGNAATLRAGRKIIGATGVISLTGSAATFTASRKLAAAAGSFALTGAGASLRAARRIAAAPGAFALDGAAASLRASRIMAASPGAFTLAGSSASLTVARRLAASVGVFTLTGGGAQLIYSPMVEGNVLVTETGQFVLTGSAVALRVTRRIPATTGIFALAGSAATIRYMRRMSIEPGAFVLAGGAAALKAARRLATESRAYVMTGGAASLRAARRMPLETGGFTLTGNPASLIYGSTIVYARAPAGNGYTPQRIESQSRPAAVGGSRPAAIQRNFR